MSKRGGKTASPIGSPDQDAPAAPPPSAGNPVESIQPDDSIDPAVRNTDDLLAGTKRMLEDVTEQLREEIEAHSRTKSMAKKREAELKIFEQAERVTSRGRRIFLPAWIRQRERGSWRQRGGSMRAN